jgi:DNA polymerase-3 subunit alpha
MRAIGQESLFGGADDAHDDFVPVDAPEYPQQEILRWEKDLLNLYLSAHPLAHISSALRRRVTAQTAQLNEEWAGQKVTLGGRITTIRRIQTKRGDTMLIAQLEDMLGSIEITVFPRAYEASADVWREEAVLLVTGMVKLREEEPQVVCDTVEVFALSEEDVTRRDYHLRITLQRTRNEPLDIAYAQDVRTALEQFPGHDTWELLVRNGRWIARLAPPKGQDGVRYCPELHQQLEGILGPGSVEALVREPVTA